MIPPHRGIRLSSRLKSCQILTALATLRQTETRQSWGFRRETASVRSGLDLDFVEQESQNKARCGEQLPGDFLPHGGMVCEQQLR